MSNNDNQNEVEKKALTVEEAKSLISDIDSINKIAQSKAEHIALNGKLAEFNESMAGAFRVLLMKRGAKLERAYAATVKTTFQNYFDIIQSDKTKEVKDKARVAVAQLRRALRTATDLKASNAGLWEENVSLTCNTIGMAGKANIEEKAHETEEAKTARIQKELDEKAEKEAQKKYDSAVTYSEAVIHWNLEDIVFIKKQLEAKFAFEKAKIEWVLNEDSEVIQAEAEAEAK